MKQKDLPQDGALFGDFREVTYVVDEQGDYLLEKSSGWEVKTAANSQYWRSVRDSVRAAVLLVKSGEASPLTYHMAVHQMDRSLLASYVGLSRWRVGRHMKAGPFVRLSADHLSRYAKVFRISVAALRELPEDADNPGAIRQWAELGE